MPNEQEPTPAGAGQPVEGATGSGPIPGSPTPEDQANPPAGVPPVGAAPGAGDPTTPPAQAPQQDEAAPTEEKPQHTGAPVKDPIRTQG